MPKVFRTNIQIPETDKLRIVHPGIEIQKTETSGGLDFFTVEQESVVRINWPSDTTHSKNNCKDNQFLVKKETAFGPSLLLMYLLFLPFRVPEFQEIQPNQMIAPP